MLSNGRGRHLQAMPGCAAEVASEVTSESEIGFGVPNLDVGRSECESKGLHRSGGEGQTWAYSVSTDLRL